MWFGPRKEPGNDTTNLSDIAKQANAACEGIPGVTATVCPSWCGQPDCRGEHNSGTMPDYLPVTGGLPRTDIEKGTHFPAVGVSLAWDAVDVSLAWDAIDDLDPCVVVHISGHHDDAQLDLRPREARALAGAILRAVDRLEES